MPVYKYYGLFEPDEGSVNVSFPDLAGCLTFGDDLADAVKMAQDALGGYLLVCEDDNDPIPDSSPVKDIVVPEGASLILVEVDTDNWRESA